MSESEQRFFIIIITDETLLQCVINNSIHFFIFKPSFLLPSQNMYTVPANSMSILHLLCSISVQRRQRLPHDSKKQKKDRHVLHSLKGFQGFPFSTKSFLMQRMTPSPTVKPAALWSD